MEIEYIISDGKWLTGCWLTANCSSSEGIGNYILGNKASVKVTLPSKAVLQREFIPNLKMISRMGKHPELIFIVYSETDIRMGYTVCDISNERKYLELDGESKDDFNKRANNEDFVHYSEWGNINQVKKSIINGADINYRNDFGMTGIMMAVSSKKMEIINYILSMNPELTHKNGNNQNVYDLANGQPEVMELIQNNSHNRTRAKE